jgi:hypothetical protein
MEPFTGADHEFMTKGVVRVKLPNPHHGQDKAADSRHFIPAEEACLESRRPCITTTGSRPRACYRLTQRLQRAVRRPRVHGSRNLYCISSVLPDPQFKGLPAPPSTSVRTCTDERAGPAKV